MKQKVEPPPRSRWRLPGLVFSGLMRMIPRRYRLRASLVATRLAAPLFVNSEIVRGPTSRVASPREILMFPILRILTLNGVYFDPLMRIEGFEHFESARAAGKGVLLVSMHTMLTALALRDLYDRGIDVTIVSKDPQGNVLGTDVGASTIRPAFTFLLVLRNILVSNGVVCAFIDRVDATERTTIEIATERGPVFIGSAPILTAVKCQSPVVFVTGRIIDGEVVVKYDGLPLGQAHTFETVMAAFAAFIQQHVTEMGTASPNWRTSSA